MTPENSKENTEVETKKNHLAPLKCVTPLSKYLAMALFIILPFLGGWVGYTYAPDKVIEKVVIVENIVEAEKVVAKNVQLRIENLNTDYSFLIEIEDKNWDKPWPIFSTSTVSVLDGDDTRILYVANEKCAISEQKTDILASTNGRSVFMRQFITSSNQILSTVSCWVAGGGYELYLIEDIEGVHRIVGFTVSEVSQEAADLGYSGFGAVEVLYP